MRWICIFSVLMYSWLCVYGQEVRGTIQGRLVDPSGAAIPKAAVVATNAATGVITKTVTTDEGNYSLVFLLPGTYQIKASATGFQSLVQEAVELRIADRLQIDLSLKIGDIASTVTVTSEIPLLQTATASLGQVIDSKRITELPVRDGSPFSLIFLSPGAVSGQTAGSSLQAPTFFQNVSSAISVSGSPWGTTEFTMDGATNMQTNYATGSGALNSPPADMVDEFKLETSFDASVGHTSGAIVNFALKTGSNQFHGTALLSHRDPDWQANSFIGNKNRQPVADFYYDRWSATATGPLRIPKIYNGANRTFFSFGYEQMRFGTPGSNFVGTVPTEAQVRGDFSQLLTAGAGYQIYDPATTMPAANGRLSRLPFAGNIIPASRLDPVGVAIAKQFPAPNTTPRVDGTNNYSKINYVDPRRYYNYVWRLDEVMTDRQRLYGRFAVNRRKDGPYRKYWESPAVGESLEGPGYQATLDHVYTLSPAFVMNSRYAFNRLAVGHSPDRLGHSPAELGFPAQTVALLTQTAVAFPAIGIDSLPAFAGEAITKLYGQNHSGFLNFTKIAGSHNFKFGTDVRSYTNFLDIPGNSPGNFYFGTNWTRGPLDNSASSPGGIGQGLASLLLGLPAGGQIDRNSNSVATSTYWSAFLHDNWRVTSRLTVDLGMRWEYEGPVTERFDRTANGFDFAYTQPIEAAARAAYAAKPDVVPADQFRLRGGLTFAGANGQTRLLYSRTFLNLAPRAGFAYQFRSQTVARGGFGVYPMQLGVPSQGTTGWTVGLYPYGFSQTTALLPSTDNGVTFQATLANPFPNGILSPAGNSAGYQTYLGRDIAFNNTATRTPYSMRWSFNLQQMLPGDWLVEAGYVGSKSIKLPVTRNMNAVPNQFLSSLEVRDQPWIDYMTANIANPMAGLLPGTGLNNPTISRSRLVVPLPQYNSVSMQDYQGWSWYNSLQLRAERRMSKGFTVIGAYTFSKLLQATSYLNAADARPSQYISANDRPHVLRISGIWELPFGRGKAVLPTPNRIIGALVGGWSMGAVYAATSGPPVFFSNPLLLGTAKDVVLPKSQRTLDRWFNVDAFERNAAKQLSWNVVRVSPYLGVRADYETQLDLSVLKKFRIGEKYDAELRGEFFNAPNHPSSFAPPNNAPTSPAFGTVTAITGTPRVVQVMLKFAF